MSYPKLFGESNSDESTNSAMKNTRADIHNYNMLVNEENFNTTRKIRELLKK